MLTFTAGEDTALAPLLPELISVLGGGGTRTVPEPKRVAGVGAKYVAIMQVRVRLALAAVQSLKPRSAAALQRSRCTDWTCKAVLGMLT